MKKKVIFHSYVSLPKGMFHLSISPSPNALHPGYLLFLHWAGAAGAATGGVVLVGIRVGVHRDLSWWRSDSGRFRVDLCCVYNVLVELEHLNVTIYNIHKTNTCNIHSHLYIYICIYTYTRRRMAWERRGAESSVVSMETLYYKTIY